MKIFVTGATGVIGRRLVPLLLRGGHDVTAVARSSAGATQLANQGAATTSVDLFDRNAVARALAGHDTVLNLATHIPHSTTQMLMPWAWRENDRLRRVASATLVDASLASTVQRFIQESFAPIYPDSGDRWIDEDVPLKPVGYNRTVLDAEAAVERFRQAGRTGVVLRFGAFYGPDASQTIALIDWVKKGRAPLAGRPDAYISSVAHDDAAAAAAEAVTMPSGVYNVVDDEPLTHLAFAESLAEAMAVAPPKLPPEWLTPLFGPVGALMARSLRISNRRLRSASRWAPAFGSVRQGWPAVLLQLRGTSTHLSKAVSEPTSNR